ncbi:uracil-DNA glycosylase, partial [Kibdelosporangium lantanae]
MASRFFQLESLYRSNAKYGPTWEPRFICYGRTRRFLKVSIVAGALEGFLPSPRSLVNGPRALRTDTVTEEFLRRVTEIDEQVILPKPRRRPEQVRVRLAKLDRLRVNGQDPYPTPGHAVGLSFSVAPEVRPIPKSLINIYKEYMEDLGYPKPSNGDLTPWTENGVLLLNRALTVMPGKPNSHQGKGWEEVTEQAIRALAARDKPLVSILWGRNARNLR